MKFKIFIISALCLPLLSGCLKPQEIPTIDGPYILQYYDGGGTCDTYTDTQGNTRLYFGLDFYSDDVAIYTTGMTGEKGEKYQALCDKHNDNDYHGEDPYINNPQKICYAKDFKSLDITTLIDFDEAHPAGSSLNDIVIYDTYTPYPWIKSGYEGEPAFTHVTKYVKDVTSEDMCLLCYTSWFSLYFTQYPLASSSAKVKVTVVTDEDEEMTFEKEMIIQ